MVCGLVMGEIEEESKFKLLIREVVIGMIMGVLCGFLVVLIVYIW